MWSPQASSKENGIDNDKMKDILEKYSIRDCRVLLKNVRLDKSLKFFNNSVKLPEERRKKYTCYICWEKFLTTKDLKAHKVIHEDEEDENHLSKSLNRTVEKNLKRKHKSSTKRTKNTSTASHENKNDLMPLAVHKCDSCKLDFESIDGVKNHPSNKCRFVCGVCNRTYNTIHAFTVHILQHKINAFKTKTPCNKLVHKCSECPESFEEYFQLKTHALLKHRAKKTSQPIENNMAERGGNQSEDPSDSTDLSCELCYDIFLSQEELQNHMEFHKQLNNGDDAPNVEPNDDTIEVVEESENITECKEESLNVSVDISDLGTVKNELEETIDTAETDNTENPIPIIQSSFSVAETENDIEQTEKELSVDSVAETENDIQPIEKEISVDSQSLEEDNSGYKVLKPDQFIPVDQYKCNICDRIYMTLNEYNEHIENKKCIIIRDCKICEANFNNNSEYYNHSNNSHDHIVCKFCFETFDAVKNLDEHKLSYHLKSFKNLCKICFHCFPTYQEFNKHLQKKHLNLF